ncbi:GNAT family protein [Amycolatopsis sp. NPDC051128]|uniref:GNAT family N-acetyltransferase n=1 Tax=Amycolatopsis sp. NPDC051128 TaxID=3155412 RepID=UPI0034488AE5
MKAHVNLVMPRSHNVLSGQFAGRTRFLGCIMGTPSRYVFSKSADTGLSEWCSTDHWGKGYATDACRSALDFAFGPLNPHRATAAIDPENAASHTVVEHLGFVHEGVLDRHAAWRERQRYRRRPAAAPRRESGDASRARSGR